MTKITCDMINLDPSKKLENISYDKLIEIMNDSLVNRFDIQYSEDEMAIRRLLDHFYCIATYQGP